MSVKYGHTMTASQEQLLKLLKEIDEICRENGIEYFLDGGTALGAYRHNGFIPWDNDADIAMTEENYYRFREACNLKYTDGSRVCWDAWTVPGYVSVFGRYISRDSSKIVQTSNFWDEENAAAGQLIDIFPLIPLPKDETEKAKMLTYYNVYDELLNDLKRHVGQRTDEFERVYAKAKRAMKFIGRRKVLSWFEKRIYNRHIEDFDEYLYGDGHHAVPLTVKREWIDEEPRYYPFEDTQLPVPAGCFDMFRQLYGDDYWMFPPGNELRIHKDVQSDTVEAKYLIRDYMRFLDKDKLLDSRRKYKDAFLTTGWNRRRAFKKTYRLTEFKINRSIEEKTKAGITDPDVLYADYYELQFNSLFKKLSEFINLTPEHLYRSTMHLIDDQEKYGRAHGVIERYRDTHGGRLDPILEPIEHLLDLCYLAQSEFDLGHFDKCLAAIEEGEEKYPENKHVKINRIKYDTHFAQSPEDIQICIDKINVLRKEIGDHEELMKYLGDMYWKQGKRDKAAEIYEDIYDRLGNGTLRLDMEHKMGGEA